MTWEFHKKLVRVHVCYGPCIIKWDFHGARILHEPQQGSFHGTWKSCDKTSTGYEYGYGVCLSLKEAIYNQRTITL